MDDAEILRLRTSVHELVSKLQDMALKNAEMHADVRVLSANLSHVQTSVKELPAMALLAASLDRRVILLERVMYGFIGVILLAVITAWLKGIIILPHTAG